MLSQNPLVNHSGECDGWNSSLKTLQPKQNTHWSTNWHKILWSLPIASKLSERTLQMCAEKDGCWLSLHGWQEKKEKGERNLRLYCAWKHCLGLSKSMHVAKIPFLLKLAFARDGSQLKELPRFTFGLPKYTALSAVIYNCPLFALGQ